MTTLSFDGDVIVVTGAGGGMGRCHALELAQRGARVIVNDLGGHPFGGGSDPGLAEQVVAEIREAGGEAEAVAVNISEPAECERLIEAARAAFGPVDVLVNNAALTYYIPIKDYPLNRWMRSWAVNFHAPFILCQLVLNGDMIPRTTGSIVNISSGAAIGPGRGPYTDPALAARGGTCYGAEKAALERFSQGLASEVYQYGVSVTALSPSQVVPTPGTVFHRLVDGMDDPRGESPALMAQAALVLATEPLDTISGRVTYSQQILKEYGLLDEARGRGVESRGSGYSEI